MIVRVVSCLLFMGTVTSTPAKGQFRNARTADYLFLTSVTDVRASWINPAGLAVVPEASIMGELVVGRVPDGNLHLDQYTVGFNSRGLSVAYQRDRFESAPSTNIVRISTGLPFPRGGIGVAVSWYAAEGPNDRDFDVGMLYSLTETMAVGFTARHLGRAEVADVKMPLVFTGGAGLTLAGGRLLFAGEARGTERLSATGFDMAYRAGGFAILPTPRPVMLIAAVDLASALSIDRVHLGVSVGGRTSVTGVGTGVERSSNPVLDRVSLSGVASNVLVVR